MLTQNNIMNIMFSKAAPKTSGVVAEYTDLNDKQAAMLNEKNEAITTLNGVAKFRLVYRTGTRLCYSPWITAANVIAADSASYAAAAEQLDYIGYNGTSGSLDADDYTSYMIRVNMIPNDMVFGNKQMLKYGIYKTGAGATQLNVARYLHDSLVKNFKRETIPYIKFERVYSGAQLSAISTLTLDVAKGSKTVTFSGDASSYVSLGSILRIGGTGAGTTPVYTVAKVVSTTVFELDVEYQGATATVAHGNVETCATGGNWGIKCTGVARSDFREGWNKYQKTTWELQLDGFTSTTVTNSVSATKGSGTYEEVAENEWFLQGNEGAVERMGTPPPKSRKDAETTGTYGTINLKYIETSNANGILGSANTATMELKIYVYVDGFIDALRGYLATSTLSAKLAALGVLS